MSEVKIKAKATPKTKAIAKVKTQEVLQVQEPQNPIFNMLQLAMVSSDVDLEKMEKIMQMADRHEEKIAFKAYNRDMALMQGEIPPIEFNSQIKVSGQVRSNYTNYEGIMKVVQPILSKFGFSVSFNPVSKDNLLTVDCMISHRDGHIETSSLSLPFDTSGSKNNVQAIGSSMSYAKRYALCLKLNIATGGEDNDGNTSPDDNTRSLEELTTMTKNANNKNELGTLWNGLTSKEQGIVSKVIGERKIELGIVKKS